MSETIFGTITPVTVDANDSTNVEIGVAFQASVSGQVTGVRFYKSAANLGTHLGNLWTGSGSKLASVTFAAETPSGWQEQDFPSPVTISAGATYVISVYCPQGRYSADHNVFATSGYSNGQHLTALANASAPFGNGCFLAGQGSGFPISNFQAANYYVDLVFVVPTTGALPNVVGLSIGTAESVLITDGYYAYPISQAYSLTVPAGAVISQNPAAGTAGSSGEPVALVVSLGPPIATGASVLEQLQVVAANRIAADPMFNGGLSQNAKPIPVLYEIKGDVLNEIERAIQSIGICVTIVTPTFRLNAPELVPATSLDGFAQMLISVFESRQMNATGVHALKAAQHILGMMNGFAHGLPAAAGDTPIFRTDPKQDSIALTNDAPALQYSIPLIARVLITPPTS